MSKICTGRSVVINENMKEVNSILFGNSTITMNRIYSAIVKKDYAALGIVTETISGQCTQGSKVCYIKIMNRLYPTYDPLCVVMGLGLPRFEIQLSSSRNFAFEYDVQVFEDSEVSSLPMYNQMVNLLYKDDKKQLHSVMRAKYFFLNEFQNEFFKQEAKNQNISHLIKAVFEDYKFRGGELQFSIVAQFIVSLGQKATKQREFQSMMCSLLESEAKKYPKYRTCAVLPPSTDGKYSQSPHQKAEYDASQNIAILDSTMPIDITNGNPIKDGDEFQQAILDQSEKALGQLDNFKKFIKAIAIAGCPRISKLTLAQAEQQILVGCKVKMVDDVMHGVQRILKKYFSNVVERDLKDKGIQNIDEAMREIWYQGIFLGNHTQCKLVDHAKCGQFDHYQFLRQQCYEIGIRKPLPPFDISDLLRSQVYCQSVAEIQGIIDQLNLVLPNKIFVVKNKLGSTLRNVHINFDFNGIPSEIQIVYDDITDAEKKYSSEMCHKIYELTRDVGGIYSAAIEMTL